MKYTPVYTVACLLMSLSIGPSYLVAGGFQATLKDGGGKRHRKFGD